MNLLGAFYIGREIGRGDRDGHGDGGSFGASLFIGIFAYITVEKYAIESYSSYLLELMVAFFLTAILIHRFSYLVYQSEVTRWGVYMLLKGFNILLCILLSFVFFHHVGGTPFSYLIYKWNLLGWETNTYVEAFGEIVWAIMKLFDLATRAGGFLVFSKVLLYWLEVVSSIKISRINKY